MNGDNIERLREMSDEVEEIAEDIDYERGSNDTQKVGLINIRSALKSTASSLRQGANLLEKWEQLTE